MFLDESRQGYLFPDTYEFFLESSIAVVDERFRENFETKAVPLLEKATGDVSVREILTVASLIEGADPDTNERRILSGIIWKRIRIGIPLQKDATICFIKGNPCQPITDEDKKLESSYQNIQHTGLSTDTS